MSGRWQAHTGTLGRGVPQPRRAGSVCASQGPSSAVIQAFDAVREFRDPGVAPTDGLPSPMGRERLRTLLPEW